MPSANLDARDPPAWGPAPSDATFLIRRCHELRTKPLDEFTVEDLRILIGQQIGLAHLVPIALQRLGSNPFAAGDMYPGDLLANVLRVDTDFWREHSELARELRSVVEEVGPPSKLDATMRKLITEFQEAEPA